MHLRFLCLFDWFVSAPIAQPPVQRDYTKSRVATDRRLKRQSVDSGFAQVQRPALGIRMKRMFPRFASGWAQGPAISVRWVWLVPAIDLR